MAMVIPMFPRQTVVGADNTEYYSEPFDVSEYAGMNVEVQLFGLIGSATPSITVHIQSADSLHTADSLWDATHSFSAMDSAPQLSNAVISTNDAGRFVRARVVVNGGSSDNAATFSVIAVAREC